MGRIRPLKSDRPKIEFLEGELRNLQRKAMFYEMNVCDRVEKN